MHDGCGQDAGDVACWPECCSRLGTWSMTKHSALQETAYRRPYEVLLLCQPISAALQAAAPEKHAATSLEHGQEPQEAARDRANQPCKPLRDITIIAVPGQHSRKPHLGRLLEPHLPARPSCLEVNGGHTPTHSRPHVHSACTISWTLWQQRQ